MKSFGLKVVNQRASREEMRESPPRSKPPPPACPNCRNHKKIKVRQSQWLGPELQYINWPIVSSLLVLFF